jgi:hypothetical protein
MWTYVSRVVVLCSIKSGKVVIMLAGRYAGRKAVVVKVSEDGAGGKRFGNCIGESSAP